MQRRGSKAVCRHARVQAHLWAPMDDIPLFFFTLREALCAWPMPASNLEEDKLALTLSNCMVSLPQKSY